MKTGQILLHGLVGAAVALTQKVMTGHNFGCLLDPVIGLVNILLQRIQLPGAFVGA
ncbi:hypothetical protein D3C81_2216700 [compost metagenome]